MEDINKSYKNENIDNKFLDILKMAIYSFIGVFIFFIPIKLKGQYLTLIHHMAYILQEEMRSFLEISIIVYTTLGCIKYILKNKGKKINVFLYLRLFSIFILVNIFYKKNEILFLDNNMLLIIDQLILDIATFFPLSALFITLILDYGLLEIIEAYFQNTMKKTFKLSGKAAVNIALYFSTNCFCGMFMTNKLYKIGKIRESESCIIILTFSLLSFPMTTYVLKELGIDTISFIVVSSFILVISNSILCRVYPLNKKKKTYYIKTKYKEKKYKKDKLKTGINMYIANKEKINIFKKSIDNLEESINILIELIPTLVIAIYIGQVILNNKIIIEGVNNIIFPIIEVLKIPNSKEFTTFIMNLFINTPIAVDNVEGNVGYLTKYLMGIIAILNSVSLSNIIYINYTEINISIKEFIISYIQKNCIIVLIYCLITYIYKGYII